MCTVLVQSSDQVISFRHYFKSSLQKFSARCNPVLQTIQFECNKNEAVKFFKFLQDLKHYTIEILCFLFSL